MLKIVYRVCCGMEAHKSFVVACIASTNEQGVTTKEQRECREEENHQNRPGRACIKPQLVQCALSAIKAKQFQEV